MIFFKKQPLRHLEPPFFAKSDGDDRIGYTRARRETRLLPFNHYYYKIDGGIRANLIKWSHTFRNMKEGEDAFKLIDRPRPKGILPIMVGLDEQGKEIDIDICDRSTLVAGASRWGKTNFLRQVLLQLMHWNHPQYLKLAVLDAKEVCFLDASNLVDVRGGYDETKAYLDFLSQELERRRKLFPLYGTTKLTSALKVRGLTSVTPPFLVVIIDELAKFFGDAKTRGQLQEVQAQVEELASQGLGFGINLFMGTQTPVADLLANLIKNNIELSVFFKMSHQKAWEYLENGAKAKAVGLRRGEFLTNLEVGLQRGRTILVDDSPFKIACKNIKRNGKDFRIFK